MIARTVRLVALLIKWHTSKLLEMGPSVTILATLYSAQSTSYGLFYELFEIHVTIITNAATDLSLPSIVSTISPKVRKRKTFNVSCYWISFHLPPFEVKTGFEKSFLREGMFHCSAMIVFIGFCFIPRLNTRWTLSSTSSLNCDQFLKDGIAVTTNSTSVWTLCLSTCAADRNLPCTQRLLAEKYKT